MTGPTPPEWGQQPGQPPYGQPPQAQPYGHAPMGPLTTQFARIDPGPSQRFGVIGATIAALGAVLILLAFTALNWYDFKGGDSHFADVHTTVTALDNAGLASSVAVIYFSWLAWALLIVAVAVAVLANLPSPLSGVMRAVGAVIGLAGAVLTGLSIKLTQGSAAGSGLPKDFSDYLSHASVGFWLAVAGFVVIAVGALVGPRHS